MAVHVGGISRLCFARVLLPPFSALHILENLTSYLCQQGPLRMCQMGPARVIWKPRTSITRAFPGCGNGAVLKMKNDYEQSDEGAPLERRACLRPSRARRHQAASDMLASRVLLGLSLSETVVCGKTTSPSNHLASCCGPAVPGFVANGKSTAKQSAEGLVTCSQTFFFGKNKRFD